MLERIFLKVIYTESGFTFGKNIPIDKEYTIESFKEQLSTLTLRTEIYDSVSVELYFTNSKPRLITYTNPPSVVVGEVDTMGMTIASINYPIRDRLGEVHEETG